MYETLYIGVTKDQIQGVVSSSVQFILSTFTEEVVCVNYIHFLQWRC